MSALLVVIFAVSGCRSASQASGDTSSKDDASLPGAPDTWDPGPALDTGDDVTTADTGTGTDTGELPDTGTGATEPALQLRPGSVWGVAQVAWVGGLGSLDGWVCDGLQAWVSRDPECGTVAELPASLPPDAWLCVQVTQPGAWACEVTLDGQVQGITVTGESP